jgi:ATP-dependent DNA helicase RecG
MRQGGGDYKCSQEEIQRMLREASEYSSDAMTLEAFYFDDIDGDTLQIYRRFLALRSPESPFLTLNDEELLLKLGCLNKDHSVHTAQLTMGSKYRIRKQETVFECCLPCRKGAIRRSSQR